MDYHPFEMSGSLAHFETKDPLRILDKPQTCDISTQTMSQRSTGVETPTHARAISTNRQETLNIIELKKIKV